MDQSSCFRQIDHFFLFLLSAILVSASGCHTSGISLFKYNPGTQKQRLSDFHEQSGEKKTTILPREGSPFSSDDSDGNNVYRPEVLDLSRHCFPQPDDSEELQTLIREFNEDSSLSLEQKQKILADIRNVDPQHQNYLIALSRSELPEKKSEKQDNDSRNSKPSPDFLASSGRKNLEKTSSSKASETIVKSPIQLVGHETEYENVRSNDESEEREMPEESQVSLVALDLPPDIMRPEEIRSNPSVSLGSITLTPRGAMEPGNAVSGSSPKITPVEPKTAVQTIQFPSNSQGKYDFTASSSSESGQQQNQPQNFNRNPIVIEQPKPPVNHQSVPLIAANSRPPHSVTMSGTTNPVNIAGHANNWENAVEQATISLYRQLSQSQESPETHRDEINLRLLHLALGNRREATRPVTGVSPELQQFWHDELLGLSTLLDQHLIPDPNQRCSVAHQHLVKARSNLKTACPIRIATMQFIDYCEGFGVYEIAPNKFEAGSRTPFYAELEDFICKKINEGEYLTKVSSSYEFLDSNGMIIAEGSFGSHERVTQSEVRDVFIILEINIPQNLVPGRYYFNLFVNDLNNPTQKSGQQRIEFTVVGK